VTKGYHPKIATKYFSYYPNKTTTKFTKKTTCGTHQPKNMDQINQTPKMQTLPTCFSFCSQVKKASTLILIFMCPCEKRQVFDFREREKA
jgi:hypothetical protein